VRKAERDFDLARHLVEEGCVYPEAIAFNSQQAAEKFLKALLVSHQVDFPKTHNLGELLDLVGRLDRTLADSLQEVTALNPFGVEYRYPGDLPDLTQDEAKAAFQLAQRVRTALTAALSPYIDGR
jgi:HEPN domain-containing protein